VATDVAANPALLAAPPAPAGWIHPDDLVGGPAPKPAPAKPAEPVIKPVEPTPEEQPVPVELPKGDEPKGDEPKGDAPKGDAPAKEDKKPAKEDKKPAKEDKPEDGE
jgi:hypothetical protein